ncbi:MAG: protoporphyrinogen oxidase [Opitutaceae bacterium]|nr:protoporphyrinogen oxidase [Opitutaceae bacterium]
MQDAIVIGGGISGLTTGYLLQQKGLDIAIVEMNPSPGGPIQSAIKNGFLIEKGPNSILVSDPWIESFINDLGLGHEVVNSNPAAANRYVVRNSRPVAVPRSPLQAITTPLFSLKAKLGFLGEPFRGRITESGEASESVADFVTRRMGREFLDYAINPFVRGVYAGDPNELILNHAFPLMRELEHEGASLVGGALKRKRRQRKEGTGFKKRSINFINGLDTLPKTISRKLGNRLWLGSEVVAVNPVENGWQVTWKKEGENFEGFSRNLFVCLPSRSVKKLNWASPIAEWIGEAPDLPYPAVHSLALGYKRKDISHPLNGFGVLVPSKEPHRILGALFNSELYPNRAPEGHCLLTVMLGGTQSPELKDAPDDELLRIAKEDLSSLLGVSGDPVFTNLTRWPHAIPQYNSAFGPWKKAIRALEEDLPGLHFGGHAIDGIAMGASIMSGKSLSERIP